MSTNRSAAGEFLVVLETRSICQINFIIIFIFQELSHKMEILFTFLILLPLFRSNDISAAAPENNLNIVIFFTHTDDERNILELESHNFLNLHVESIIKPSPEDSDTPGSAYCKVHLKNSLLALTRFCHTVMKMKTAITSVSNKEMIYEIQEPEKVKRFIRSASTNEQTPSEVKNVITNSKHTEVFEIRARRNAKTKDDNEQKPKRNNTYSVKIISEVPVEERTRKPWATFDIMAHLRYSFFGPLFAKESKDKSDGPRKGLKDIPEKVNEQIDTRFFDTVKSTLISLLDAENGFLMVIFGGHLNTINNEYGSLAQSIKHIIETVNCENNTLIILTGSCTNHLNDYGPVVTMPVYSRGPYGDRLSECNFLYDIPMTVKKSLEIHREQASIFPTDP